MATKKKIITTRTTERHQQAAHDLTLMVLLLEHHELLLRGDYQEAEGECFPLIIAAREAVSALSRLATLIQERAAAEYPDENFEHFTLENYDGCWPPRITDKGGA